MKNRFLPFVKTGPVVLAACFAPGIVSCGGDSLEGSSAVAQGLAQQRSQHKAATPVYFTQYTDPLGPVRAVNAAVDEAGDTYVLAIGGPDFNEIYKFDDRGAFVWRASAGGQHYAPHAIRANDTGVAVGGTESGIPPLPHSRVDRFEPGGTELFVHDGPMFTTFGALDLCAGGATVVAENGFDGSAAVVRLDAAGAVLWRTPVDDLVATSARCSDDGDVRVAGTSSAGAPVAVEFEEGGTLSWRWTAPETVSGVTLDVNRREEAFVGATLLQGEGMSQIVVYALGARGRELWRFASGGPNDSLGSLSAGGLVAVTGMRGADLFTLELDLDGRLRWARTETLAQASTVQSLALTRADDAFVCAGPQETTVVLYDRHGKERLAFETSELGAVFAGVARSIGRCVGSSGDGVGILAFHVH